MGLRFGGLPRALLQADAAAAAQAALSALDVQSAVLTDGTSFDLTGTGWQTITPADLTLTAAASGRYAIGYAIRGRADASVTDSQEIRARLTKNGTAIAGSEVSCVRQPSGSVIANDQSTGTRTVYETLAATDIIRVEVQQEQDTTTGQVISNSSGRCSLSLQQVS